MSNRFAGAVCAAAMLALVGAASGQTQSEDAQAQQPPTPARAAVSPEAGDSNARPAEQKVTLEGCLVHEPGAPGGEDEFLLRYASVMPQEAVADGTPRAEADTVKGAVGTSGSAGADDAPKPPAGPAPEPKTYRLEGDRERGIDPWVGHRVTIVGTLDSDTADAGRRSREPVAATVTVHSIMPAEGACGD